MQRKTTILIVIIFSLIISSFLFYWFQWRPMQIRKNCYGESEKNAKNLLKEKVTDQPLRYSDMAKTGDYFKKDDFQFYYQNCLRKYGLEK